MLKMDRPPPRPLVQSRIVFWHDRQRSRTMHSLTMVFRNEAVSAAGLTRLAGQSCTRSAPFS